MSLGIVFKGPEGIVLAADSRVTLTGQRQQEGNVIATIPATFDNATKLLKINGQEFIGAVTFGLGAIGQKEPRTAHSFLPEFEAELVNNGNKERLSVEEFARKLGAFFMERWAEVGMPEAKNWQAPPMIFLIGGYDKGSAYGRVFEVQIPFNPKPIEQNEGEGSFGMVWGGQTEFVDRLLQGFDRRVFPTLMQQLQLDDKKAKELDLFLKQNFSIAIPYQFLPLQDCVDLAIFLIRTTIQLQTWLIDVRGVGGAIDVATITRTDGFNFIQQKAVRGERS